MGCHNGAGWSECGQSTAWKDWKCWQAKADYAVETLKNPSCVESSNLNVESITALEKYCGSDWRENYLEDESEIATLIKIGFLMIINF